MSFKAMGDILLSGGHLFGSDLLSTVVNRRIPPTRFSLLTMEITLVSTLPKARIVHSLIIGREVLILTLSILLALQGCISDTSLGMD